jgi:cardiolipin synthase
MPESHGFVQPYGDLPFDKEAVGETMYMSILDKARHYRLPSRRLTSFIGRRDEEIRSRMPPNAGSMFGFSPRTSPIRKRSSISHEAYYGDLLKAGCKIYEYTPGFVHEKDVRGR